MPVLPTAYSPIIRRYYRRRLVYGIFPREGTVSLRHLLSASALQWKLLNSAVEIALSSFPKNDFIQRNQLSQDVLLYIEEHLLDPSFSIYTISETFGLSESAFSHLFKRPFHITCSSYVHKQKLIHAFDLLCDESILPEEVALRLGYSRSSDFCCMFKAEVGMPRANIAVCMLRLI